MPHAPRLFLSVLVLTLPALGSIANAQPLTAIVNVRIIDGSGNEPFVGTVVIEGGRIRAAGRTVDVPAGAVTIDGAGRTVLPGLIDARLRVDGAADRDGAARSLAAALYSGVTSAGVAGLAPDRLDAVRALTGRPESGPRAVLIGMVSDAATGTPDATAAAWARILRAGVQAIALPANAVGGDAIAADARSRGLKVMVDARDEVALDRVLALEPSLVIGVPPLAAGTNAAAQLPQRNVTVAPDLVHAAAGRAQPATPLSDELATAGATAPPVDGAAGRTSPESNDSQWSARVAAVRALREARARLAAASDVGDPPTAGGTATQGVIHLLVSAGVPPLEAVTAATSGGAWALGLQSDRGFLAAGMRADLLLVQGDPSQSIADLSKIERVFLGGVDVDRPALLAKIRSLTAPPAAAPPTAGAVTPTGPARVAEATPKKDAGPAERPNSRRRGRDRRTPAPPAATPESAAATATPPVATPPASPSLTPPAPPETVGPPAETATPAPVTPAPATPAAPAATPSTAAAAGAAPARLEDPLIDDFEQSGNGGSLSSAWSSTANDGAAATIVMGRVIRGLRDHALHLTARMGQGAAPFVRASIPVSRDGRPVDVSRFRGIRFDARGEGRYRIVFVTRDVADGRYHESYFSGSPNWTPVGIPFASIGQNGKGGHAPFTGRDLIEIRFEIARDAGQLAWLELDNVRFY